MLERGIRGARHEGTHSAVKCNGAKATSGREGTSLQLPAAVNTPITQLIVRAPDRIRNVVRFHTRSPTVYLYIYSHTMYYIRKYYIYNIYVCSYNISGLFQTQTTAQCTKLTIEIN